MSGLRLASTLLAAAALAGCGGEDEPRPADPPAAAIDVSLAITFHDGEGNGSTARLRCAGGAVTASRWLASRRAPPLCDEARGLARFLAAEPQRAGACTQIYGGPQRARIRGRVGDSDVDRSFTRRNGCEIADWERVEALLPPLR